MFMLVNQDKEVVKSNLTEFFLFLKNYCGLILKMNLQIQTRKNTNIYRPQRKVMFSEAFVYSQGREGLGRPVPRQTSHPRQIPSRQTASMQIQGGVWTDPARQTVLWAEPLLGRALSRQIPSVLTSSEGLLECIVVQNVAAKYVYFI